MATFAEDALVNDQLRDYWESFNTERGQARFDYDELTMSVTKVIDHYGNFIVTANIDGHYDKRGRLDPLALALLFHRSLVIDRLADHSSRSTRYLRIEPR